jgi:predicted membrane protein
MNETDSGSSKAWLGIVFVALGGYFLLRNFDMIPSFIPYYFFGWEMILIIIGGAMLVTGRKEGFIFLAIGGFFILPDIFYWPHFHFRDWWPVVLIVIGVVIVLRRRAPIERQPGESDNDFIDDTAIFGGSDRSFTSQNFKGGKITSIFGGSEINFSGAEIADEEAVLDVFCLFGGNAFTVPNDWTVINESFVIFGGYGDKRSKSSNATRDPKKVLRIKGSVIFGGSEVKGS